MMVSVREAMIRLLAVFARLYLRLPVKPFRKTLGKLYSRCIYSGAGRSHVRKRIDGINYELDLREVIDYAMYWQGSREPDTSRALKQLCKRGDIVFDIGANIGSHALPMASHVGTEGGVYAFEPVPWAMGRLKRNLELNDMPNLVLEPIALSDEQGEVEMKLRASFRIGSGTGVGATGKVDEGWWNECEQVKVRMDTLDNYVASHGIERLDLIKLDVDGFEGKVLRGARQTLKRMHPIIIMEVAPAWIEMRGDSAASVLHELDQAGYSYYREADFAPIRNLAEVVAAIPRDGGFNLLASARPLSQ